MSSTTFDAAKVPALGTARRGLSALIALLMVGMSLTGWSRTMPRSRTRPGPSLPSRQPDRPPVRGL